MSTSYRNRHKAKRAARSVETRELDNKIKKGILPAFHFAKDPKTMQMETVMAFRGRYTYKQEANGTVTKTKVMEPKRTWRQVSTRIALAVEPEKKE